MPTPGVQPNVRNQTILVKVGGSIQDDPAQITAVMRDVAALATAGARPIVVHGGGKAITAAMKDAGLQARFVAGQRYTDEPTLRIAERVLAGTINSQLVAALQSAGAKAQGLHSLGTCVLTARKGTHSGKPGEAALDLGFVGEVTRVDAGVLRDLGAKGIVPVIAPIARDENPGTGPGKLNVNADLAAGVIARDLKPDRFILVSDTAGVRTNPADPASSVATLSPSQIDSLIASGAIDGGMLPKIQACLAALRAGCAHIAIVDGRVPGALLASMDSGSRQGTRIVAS